MKNIAWQSKSISFNGVKHSIFILAFYSLLFTAFFSPVLFSNRYLSPGDSFIQSIPAFTWNLDLWNMYLFSGFPQFADPQAMMWYMPRLLFNALSFNLFIVSAYVFAGSFMYGYVFHLTRSIFVSLFAGITFSMSGFFMAHLGHVNMIHAACWLPLLLLGLEKMKALKGSRFWFLITALAVVNIILAGHPQIMFYCLALSALYLCFLSYHHKKVEWTYFITSSFAVMAGILIAGVQLIPTFELSGLSVRSTMTYSMFNEYSLPLKQVFILFFPYLFGGLGENLYGAGYFGRWNLTEISSYVGWLPMLLASVAIFSRQIFRNKLLSFWAVIMAVSFVLSLGDATFLSKVMFHVPGYNLFRAPARNLLEFCFAISVLGAFGLHKILNFDLQRRKILLGHVVFVAFVLSTIILNYNDLVEKAKEKGVMLSVDPFSNIAITIPLLFLLLSLGVFLMLKPNQGAAAVLCIVVLICDLSSFGWFYEWRFATPEATAIEHKEGQASPHSRVVIPESVDLHNVNLTPNTNQMSNIMSVNGYNPLLLKSYHSFVNMETRGSIDRSRWNNTVIDLLAGKYIYVSDPPQTVVGDQLEFSDVPLNLHLSKNNVSTLTFNVNNFGADQIGIIARLSNSVGLTDNVEVAKIHIVYADDDLETKTLLAGKDVSEWAYDRSDVKTAVQHSRAAVYNSFEIKDATLGETFLGHNYHTVKVLTKDKPVRSMSVVINDIPEVYLDISSISLFNSAEKVSYQANINDTLFSDNARWVKHDLSATSNIIQYENKMALPMVRSVRDIQYYSKDEILNIITNNRLPNGEPLNIASTALLSEQPEFDGIITANSNLELIDDDNDFKLIRSNHASPSFVVISNVNYPGWKAYIDGIETKVYETDYLLQGVYIPAGNHTIEMRFEPVSFKIGVICLLLGLFCIIGYVVFQTVYYNKKPKGLNSNGSHFR
ncbi:YfhO family protein [Paenibacillus xerothermodurans]|uniref:YfhO family protein n=1 Tax=Paenibacillus xerothermodurans TaxID=1977292 RepID=A0A2W1NAY4_PAEXE|nr:YfhO family protein [Paenibacillus xerothermodurans]PZE20810.1 hypothetical protein CBW46_011695 [Paenibacillus xerothermodurans]